MKDKKEHPVLDVIDEKILQNTGTKDRPFWAKVGDWRKVRLFGMLIFRHKSTSNFPDPADKE